MDRDPTDKPAIEGVLTILTSLGSKNPAQYILNYDAEENAGGVTINQLKTALFKVIKGKDKTLYIARGSSKEFLKMYSGKLWMFDSGSGVVSLKPSK